MFHGMSKKALWVSLLVAGLYAPAAVYAGGPPPLPDVMDQSVISGDALSHVHGIVNVNLAAGSGNAQANATAIAEGVGGTTAHTGITQSSSSAGGVSGSAMAHIGGQAFSNASGLISVNQASGVGNTQANGIAVALGIGGKVVTDNTLAGTLSNAGGLDDKHDGPSGSRDASVGDNAFAGAHGIIQVNQSAGSGNVTANSFALNVNLGAKP